MKKNLEFKLNKDSYKINHLNQTSKFTSYGSTRSLNYSSCIQILLLSIFYELTLFRDQESQSSAGQDTMKLATITLNKPSSECNTCIFFNSIIRSQLKYGFTDKVMVISPFIREAASVAVATTYNDYYVETFQEKLKFNCSYRES